MDWHLVNHGVCLGCPLVSINSGLVREGDQPLVQPCLELQESHMHISEFLWDEVEEPFTVKDASLALATAGGRLEGTWWTAASLPLLGY